MIMEKNMKYKIMMGDKIIGNKIMGNKILIGNKLMMEKNWKKMMDEIIGDKIIMGNKFWEIILLWNIKNKKNIWIYFDGKNKIFGIKK